MGGTAEKANLLATYIPPQIVAASDRNSGPMICFKLTQPLCKIAALLKNLYDKIRKNKIDF